MPRGIRSRVRHLAGQRFARHAFRYSQVRIEAKRRLLDEIAARQRVKMSQAEFSRAYGVSKRELQEWKRGGRQPDSAAGA